MEKPILHTRLRQIMSTALLVATMFVATQCSVDMASPTSTTTTTASCDGVGCSGHGTCSIASSEPVCTCAAGYAVSGLNCVATTGPCAGVTCSGHGSCAANGSTPACTCDQGYAASGMTCVATTGACAGVTCSGHGTCVATGSNASCTCDSGDISTGSTDCVQTMVPTLGGCAIFPANHIFNTAIDKMPIHPNSAAYMATIGSGRKVHLDLGQSTDITMPDSYFGIPYNIVHGNSFTWPGAKFYSPDKVNMNWDPAPEADCAVGSAHTLVSPCTGAGAANPVFPIPSSTLVEGGIDKDPSQPYGDHHMLLLDADTCRLWELYHSYPDTTAGWDIFGSATFDLKSNALRPATWTSADAAGFPILPLLLRADEATTGVIRHALRFTIESSKIRAEYTWPARHITGSASSQSLPQMGQLLRVKASYVIPTSFNAQSQAIVKALQTYGMYLADGGSDMYIQGDPNTGWLDATFSQVQGLDTSVFEAVDLSPIAARAGFDPNSAAVPP